MGGKRPLPYGRRSRYPSTVIVTARLPTRPETPKSAACGFGSLAMAGLLAKNGWSQEGSGGGLNPVSPRQSHFPAGPNIYGAF